MKSIAIFTHSNDNSSIQDVSERIKDAGLNVIRFDTDLYPTRYLIDAEMSNTGCKHRLITPQGEQFSTEELSAIWYRRFYTGKGIDINMEPQFRSVCVDESRTGVIGLLSCLDCFQLDAYWDIRLASVKDYQQKLATQIGFDIPCTLVTNNGDNARAFYSTQNGDVVTKTQGSFGVTKNGEEQVMFTSDLSEKDLLDTEGLKHCPMVFQKKIKKALELRVTVVGNQIFCAAIDSSRHAEASTDWRKLATTTMDEWFKYQLPDHIEEKVIKLTKALNLNYGAIDILLTPDDKYVFLEINPCGEFYWLEKYVGFDICDAIANLIVESC